MAQQPSRVSRQPKELELREHIGVPHENATHNCVNHVRSRELRVFSSNNLEDILIHLNTIRKRDYHLQNALHNLDPWPSIITTPAQWWFQPEVIPLMSDAYVSIIPSIPICIPALLLIPYWYRVGLLIFHFLRHLSLSDSIVNNILVPRLLRISSCSSRCQNCIVLWVMIGGPDYMLLEVVISLVLVIPLVDCVIEAYTT